jgi:VRR-NUC domain
MAVKMTPAQRRDRSVLEADFQAQLIDLAHLYGWRVAHFRPCQTGRGWRTPVQGDGAGFPDLVLVGRGRVFVAELKRETAKATPEQLAWLTAFADAGVQAFVWRPSDFDEIAAELARSKEAPSHD